MQANVCVFVCIGELKRETKHRCGTQKEQEREGAMKQKLTKRKVCQAATAPFFFHAPGRQCLPCGIFY